MSAAFQKNFLYQTILAMSGPRRIKPQLITNIPSGAVPIRSKRKNPTFDQIFDIPDDMVSDYDRITQEIERGGGFKSKPIAQAEAEVFDVYAKKQEKEEKKGRGRARRKRVIDDDDSDSDSESSEVEAVKTADRKSHPATCPTRFNLRVLCVPKNRIIRKHLHPKKRELPKKRERSPSPPPSPPPPLSPPSSPSPPPSLDLSCSSSPPPPPRPKKRMRAASKPTFKPPVGRGRTGKRRGSVPKKTTPFLRRNVVVSKREKERQKKEARRKYQREYYRRRKKEREDSIRKIQADAKAKKRRVLPTWMLR